MSVRPFLLLLSLLLGLLGTAGCSKRHGPQQVKRKPPPPEEIRDDKYIVRRNTSEWVLDVADAPSKRAYAVFAANLSPRLNYDARLDLTDYLVYQRQFPGKKRVQQRPYLLVPDPKVREKLAELSAKLARLKKPVVVRLTFRNSKTTHYTESGFRLGLQGGEESQPWIVDDMTLHGEAQ